MEFKSLKNIETSFRQLRLFGIVYLCVCTLLVFFSVWKAYTFAEAQREKIYVLDEGKSLMLALSQDLEQNRPVEAREHVRRFHELFFTLSPDKSAIEGNIQRAMFLSDRSAYAHYVDLAEQGYYNRIISGNMSQRIGIDSVRCDFNTYPYEVVTYAKLSIIRIKLDCAGRRRCRQLPQECEPKGIPGRFPGGWYGRSSGGKHCRKAYQIITV